jgi:hypothetical protein
MAKIELHRLLNFFHKYLEFFHKNLIQLLFLTTYLIIHILDNVTYYHNWF